MGEKTFGQQLKKIRKRKGMTQDELATLLGTSKQVISRYESNQRSPKITVVQEYAEKLNVPLDTLLKESNSSLVAIDFGTSATGVAYRPYPAKYVPLIGAIAAGQPIEAVENIDDWLCVDKNDDVDFALRVRGDSMTGVGIYDGDIIFIKRQPMVENGEIAAVMIDEGFPDTFEATCKKFYKYGSSIVLRSENPNYKEIEIKKGNGKNVTILGKVIFLKSYMGSR